MTKSERLSRRDFLARSARTAAGIAASGAVLAGTLPQKVLGANDRVRVAVAGLNGRGTSHLEDLAKIPGVEVTCLVDPDTRLFPAKASLAERLFGARPQTVVDLRKALEDKDLDAVTVASPDHWHALLAIWACQAGKHVYVEKPISHSIWEGEKLVEAARKYNRAVQCGMQNRSITGVRKAMEFLQSGELGDIYMAKGLCFKKRNTIGKMKNTPVPDGLDWDMWLGPASWRPFNPQYVHYNWHWFWDFGCTDLGNQGPHQMDIARWGMGKDEVPGKVKCVGGKFAFDDDQESPNTQMAVFEYADGKILQFEVRGLYTNDEDGIRIGNLFYGTKGWMHLRDDKWATYWGYDNKPGPKYDGSGEEADPNNLAGTGSVGHFMNFIDAIRKDDWTVLTADVAEGHKSTAMCHLANISNRVGRELEFDTNTYQFVDDDVANGLLRRRRYRYPYIVPEIV